MKYLVFLFAIIAAAQTPPPSSNASTLRGKGPCSATVTTNCIVSAEYGLPTGTGTGDVLGAASVQSGRVPYGSGTAATLTSSSKFAYNDTAGMGLIPPLSLGQNGTAAGRINLLGSTSGSYPIEVNADGTSITFTGAAVFTGPITAGSAGPLGLTAIAAPATPSAGTGSVYVDSTSKNLAVKDDAGVVKHGVQTKAAVTNQVVSAIADDGTVTTRALASGDIPNNAANTSGLAGTATALAANGSNCSAGSFPLGVNASGAVEDCTANSHTVRRSYGVAVGDPAGSALATGVLGYVVVPVACTIVGWDIIVDAGTATVDVLKIATGTAKPTASIAASALPAIASGTMIHSTTLTGWTTSVAANDALGFNLTTVATAKYITVAVQCDQTVN